MKNLDRKHLVPLIFRALALGLSVAGLVLVILGIYDTEEAVKFLLGAVVCLSIGCINVQIEED